MPVGGAEERASNALVPRNSKMGHPPSGMPAGSSQGQHQFAWRVTTDSGSHISGRFLSRSFFTVGFAAVRQLAHGLFRWRALSYWQWRFDTPDTWPQNGAATGTVRVDGALFLRATCRRLAPILDERRRLEKWLPATAEATPAAQN